MDSGRHFSPDDIVAFLQDQTDQNTTNRINEFKTREPGYRSFFELLAYTKQELNFSNELLDKNYKQLGISEKDDFLMRLLSGNLQPDDNYLLLNELNHPSSRLYDSLIGDLEESAIAPAIPFWERVPWLAKIFGQPAVPSRRKVLANIIPGKPKGPEPDPPISIIERILDFAASIPAAAYVVLLIITLSGGGIWGGLRYYNTTYKINLAAELLKENYQVFIEDTPRLSGDYASTGISLLMDEGETPDYLEQALDLTEHAIENGSKSAKARQIQAQVYLIPSIVSKDELDGRISKADSVLKNVDDVSKNKSASFLNDLGVLNFVQKNWQEAKSYFKLAIKKDPQLKEAHYNLALTLHKLGDNQAAIALLEKYNEIEPDQGWKNAALNFLTRLQQLD